MTKGPEKVRDLMAALEESLERAKATARKPNVASDRHSEMSAEPDNDEQGREVGEADG